MAETNQIQFKLERKDYKLAGLQARLRVFEAGYAEVTEIVSLTSGTGVTVKQVDAAPKPLSLFLDPGENMAPPTGLKLVIRGSAWVENRDEKVALFRPN